MPFTAVCCANDLLALGALGRLAELGIAVPDAVSVAGFDDISTAALTAPSLSTVRLPLREMGRRGFAHATGVLAGDEPAREVLPTEVVLRDSHGGPAGPAGRGRLMGGALAGRVVLITGSSRGIGAEVAVKAAAEGAVVAVHYRTRSADAAASTLDRVRAAGGAEAEPFAADIADGRAGGGARRAGHRAGSGASTASSTTPG